MLHNDNFLFLNLTSNLKLFINRGVILSVVIQTSNIYKEFPCNGVHGLLTKWGPYNFRRHARKHFIDHLRAVKAIIKLN